jgi:cullin-associated NEDD8-dissociated protein 1
MLASEMHDPVHIRLSLSKTLLPELCQAVQEQWYKVIAEALRALAEVPRYFVLGYTSADDEETKEKERKFVAGRLYTSIEPLLAAHDVDQEIKECALNATASLLSYLHSSLSEEQTSRLLLLLLERLKNETTRIAAIKTISSVAAADSCCDLSPILAESIKAMSTFLRLQSRTLKQSSLTSLDMIVTNHGSDSTLTAGDLYRTVLEDISRLITDKDLHLSHLSL